MTVKTKARKISHVISSLTFGGAEMMLLKLLSHMDRSAFESRVISLTGNGVVGEKIQKLGVPVFALGMRRGSPNPVKLLALAQWLRRGSPELIQTWMYNADLAGGLAGRLASSAPVIWNIRHSNFVAESRFRTAALSAKVCSPLSHWIPTRIICCSEASRSVHTQLGYATNKMVVIPNGFDLRAFHPDEAARRSVRQELNLSDEALLIGLVARFHPQKDHRNFVQAASRLAYGTPDVHFLLCGEGITWENEMLASWIEATRIRDRFHLLGPRDDIPRLNAAMDIASSSSAYGEGFPNIIGEAMACGVSCAVTDVGDSAIIVGDTGRVVPPGTSQSLAEAWQALIEIGPVGRSQLGLAARRRVEEHFNIASVVARYRSLYEDVLNDGGSNRRA